MDIKRTYLWTDSQVTLTWIKTHSSQWKDYVRNRVSQIQDLTTHAHWKFVPGTANPADCASRGLTTAQLEDHELWWAGPPWLLQPDQWPTQPTGSEEQYSSLNRLLRITTLCQGFVLRLKGQYDRSRATCISVNDIKKAKIFWIKATQSAFFAHELKVLSSQSHLPTSHPYSRLTAFIDHQVIARVGGRLSNSTLTYEGKHPAILPRHSRLSELIIDCSHKQTLHGSTQLTLAHIRQSYWIIGGRAPVKSHVLRCVVCARQREVRAHQLMGQLPLPRVTPTRAFTHTSIDYAGPLTLKTWKGRGAKTHKGWICVFVCLTTFAVHLEVVSDYSTDGFR
ncbi:PREDICTED: uncharacterized protein LOC108757178 [Trachymyrmex septentrionalis]|uniref:uncharacterized protein LOC108757178 n=1 Tax=Trachymyrmex septentrionalis TaxID=34720 RepID=UPI00084F733C|nr:PREDICTED: uncharacterized protein LOC108757178 [Trachymyrmex septentrionalis]